MSSEGEKMIERVMQLIKQSGLSDNAFEKQLHLSQGTVGNWRSGRNKLSMEAIIKLARYFNVSADYLLGLTDERKPLENREIGQIASPDDSVPALFEDMPDLLSEQRFVNTAKIYHELPDELRERAYMLIYGMALGIGLNVDKIIG